MDRVTLSILIPIILTIASAFAFVAYRQPREFRTMAIVLQILTVAVMIGGGIWGISNITAKTAAINSGAISYDKYRELTAAIDAYSLPWWWFPVLWIPLIYIWILLSLPYWLLTESRKREATPRHEVNDKPHAGTQKE